MIGLEELRAVLSGIASIGPAAAGLAEDDDLFARGLDSFGSVQLMLALEERCDVEFPDHLLNRRSFASMRAIREALAGLSVGVAA